MARRIGPTELVGREILPRKQSNHCRSSKWPHHRRPSPPPSILAVIQESPPLYACPSRRHRQQYVEIITRAGKFALCSSPENVMHSPANIPSRPALHRSRWVVTAAGYGTAAGWCPCRCVAWRKERDDLAGNPARDRGVPAWDAERGEGVDWPRSSGQRAVPMTTATAPAAAHSTGDRVLRGAPPPRRGSRYCPPYAGSRTSCCTCTTMWFRSWV